MKKKKRKKRITIELDNNDLMLRHLSNLKAMKNHTTLRAVILNLLKKWVKS